MHPFEFVIAILFMIFAFALLKQRHESRKRIHDRPENAGETLRLRQEVGELKERIKVLERITVEKENSLARQIDELRDR